MKLFIAIALLLIADCKASYYYNLAQSFGINPKFPPQGAKVEKGPDGKDVLVFGPNAPPVFLKGPSPAYMITALSDSKDFTYFTEFKMPATPMTKDDKWEFFSLLGINGEDTYTLFSVGLKMKSTGGASAENVENPDGKRVQVLFVSQDKSSDAELVITDVFKPNTWYKLSIRICPTKTCGASKEVKEANVRKRRAASTPALYGEVRIDCKDPPIGYLEFESNFKRLIPYGFAAYGSSLTGVSKPVAKNRFPGPMRGSQLINGADAFAFYSSCFSKFKVQKIPSEPRPNEYNENNLKAFLKASSGASVQVSLSCPGTNPVKYRGEKWRIDKCRYNQCNENGKVVLLYVCRTCEDKTTGEKYVKNDKWIDPNDKCQEITCLLGFRETSSAKVNCKTITKDDCGGYEPLQLQTECCLKCGNDTCPKGKHYYSGCDKRCEDAPNFTCAQPKLGCWCPEGSVENAKGQCIDIGKCTCQSGTVTYEPGQSAIRSPCTSCVCNRGLMKCFDTC